MKARQAARQRALLPVLRRNFGHPPTRGRHRVARESHDNCVRRFRVNNAGHNVHVLRHRQRECCNRCERGYNNLYVWHGLLRKFVRNLYQRAAELVAFDGLELRRWRLTSATDENGKITSTTYNDPNFWRPAS